MNIIALKMLLGDRTKYAGILFGIAFTSFLVTFAASYFGGMMTRSFALIAENPRTDVWVMDPHSGEPLLKFWTKTGQDQIAFSKDGGLIYVTNDSSYDSPPAHKGAIRVFSADSGALVQTISAGPKGVHSSFSLSPDGSLIAADASTDAPRGWDLEIPPFEKISRVVLLDAKTGDLLFEHHERTERYKSDPLGFAFPRTVGFSL